MTLRNVILCAALAASGIPLAFAQSGRATLEMSADGEIQVAPDGHVLDYRLGSKLVPAIADIVDRHVRSWRFEPIVVDGTAVAAKTSMHLALTAEPVPGKDDYRLRVSSVRFGDLKRSASHLTPPQYPPEAVRAHVGGKVLVAVRVDATGAVVEAQAYQTSLDVRTRNEAEAEHFRRVLEKASIAAASHWSYDISQTINGKPVGTSALVPVSYSLCNLPCTQHPDAEDHWRALMPGPIRPAPWMHEQVADNAAMSLRDDQALPVDSRFRLKDDVVGKLL